MAKERVLITVKTYPVLSAKYAELVCTAGINQSVALEKVKQRYWSEYMCSGKYSPLFILGTVEEHQRRKLPNQFLIIGVVPLPVETPNLFKTQIQFPK